jgi:hypothetical protein
MSESFETITEAAKLQAAAEHDLESQSGPTNFTDQAFAQMQTHPNDLAVVISKLEDENNFVGEHAQIDATHINEGRTICIRFEPGTFEISARYRRHPLTNTPLECVNGVTPPTKFDPEMEARIMRDTARAEFAGLAQLEPDYSVNQMVQKLSANPYKLKLIASELEKNNASAPMSWFTNQPQAEIAYKSDGMVSSITFKKAFFDPETSSPDAPKTITAKLAKAQFLKYRNVNKPVV